MWMTSDGSRKVEIEPAVDRPEVYAVYQADFEARRWLHVADAENIDQLSAYVDLAELDEYPVSRHEQVRNDG
jgi:hypothetical protein